MEQKKGLLIYVSGPGLICLLSKRLKTIAPEEASERLQDYIPATQIDTILHQMIQGVDVWFGEGYAYTNLFYLIGYANSAPT